MREIADILRKNNIPYRFENTDLGLQLRFDWCDGDVVCHEGTSHMPESMGFPWDDGDVTREDSDMMAQLIIEYYRKQTAPLKKYRVHIEYDAVIEAEDEDEALTFALSCVAIEDCDISIIDPRQEWIDQHYKEAMDAVNSTDCYNGGHIAHLKFCKDATIFIRHWMDDDDYIGVAAPRHGDKYDRKTGIAVAYAKAMGEAVPDYI